MGSSRGTIGVGTNARSGGRGRRWGKRTAVLAAVASLLVVMAAQCQPDKTPPTARVAAPSSGAWLRGGTSVSAAASDNVGVTRVEFHLSGNGVADTVIATGTADPHYGWYAPWDTTTVANGAYVLRAVAFDAAGNRGTSDAITVNVANPHITVTPSTGLHGGDKVVITGTGFHNSYGPDYVYVEECGRRPADACDVHTVLAEQPADANGNITIDYYVRRVLDTPQGETIDCAVANTCSIAVSPPTWAPIWFASPAT